MDVGGKSIGMCINLHIRENRLIYGQDLGNKLEQTLWNEIIGIRSDEGPLAFIDDVQKSMK